MQLSTGTAKEISEISEVPRRRVYDAIRVLKAQGLVEVQHSNPQQYRAVSVEEPEAADEAVHELAVEFSERLSPEGVAIEKRGLNAALPIEDGLRTERLLAELIEAKFSG